jgi:alpha-tubulin suppressor-like RCC1 family protein
MRSPQAHTHGRHLVTAGLALLLLASVAAIAAWRPIPSAAAAATRSVRSASPTALAVAGGGYHTCLLTGTGGVECWGNNFYGELGDGQSCGGGPPLPPDCPAPVSVSGLTSGVVAVTAGEDHSCALTSGGGVKCWGLNAYGQLGDGTTTDRHTPVDVSGLTSGVVAIAAGQEHTCAVTSAGGAKCWGLNDSGQLGDGTQTDRHVPVDVSGLATGVAALSAGYGHSCALTGAGAVKCWGANGAGQLGDDQSCGNTQCLTPVDVAGLGSGVAAISAASAHACALTGAGGLKCWGANEVGELGDGTTNDRHVPVDVSGPTSGVAGVAAGGFHSCALTGTGGAKCWGWNHFGQLGNGSTTDSSTAVAVSGLTSGLLALAGGDRHTCALTTAGRLACWGRNGFGELGNGTHDNSPLPVYVLGFGPPPPPPPPPPPSVAPKCRVPNVVGQKLATAKAKIRKRHCRVGKVSWQRSRASLKGRVLRQSPKAGARLGNGARINLRAGKGR